MFWISIAALSSATALVQLGALAVTVQILKVMSSVAVSVALALALALVWRRRKDSGL